MSSHDAYGRCHTGIVVLLFTFVFSPLFDSAQYQRQHNAPSYWRAITPMATWPSLSRDETCDVAIIGAGLSGLSTALHLARDHHLSTVVLEAGDLAWGASGRNGGFNTLPAMKLSVHELLNTLGEHEACLFLQSQRDATELIAHFADDEKIALQPTGDGVISVAHKPSATTGLRDEWRVYQRAGLSARWLDQTQCRAEIHNTTEAFGALHLHHGFGLNPLALSDGLARRAHHYGSRIFTHSAVTALHKNNGGHELHTAHGIVRARTLVLASNAYRDLIDSTVTQSRFIPAISNIIVTEAIDDARWNAMGWTTTTPIANTRHLLHYYRRLPDNRLLLGARGDLSGSVNAGLKMRAQLLNDMVRLFPALDGVKVDYFWNGLVSLTPKRLPTFGKLPDDPSIFFSLGCFGNGVNTMPWIGRAIARLIADQPLNKFEQARAYCALPSRVPSSRFLRTAGLHLAYQYYALRDRFF